MRTGTVSGGAPAPDYTRVTLAWTPELRKHALPFLGAAAAKPRRAVPAERLFKKVHAAFGKHGATWRDGLTLRAP